MRNLLTILLLCLTHLARADEIHDLVKSGDLDAVLAALKSDPSQFNAKDGRGWTPLHHAASLGQTATVRALLKQRTNPNARTKFDSTPLTLAVGESHLATAKVLLQSGAEPDQPGEKLVTALSLAAADGHLELVKLLLEHGAQPDLSNARRVTPLHRAARAGHRKVVEELVTGDAQINAATTEGETPLNWALAAGQAELAARLRELGGQPGRLLPRAAIYFAIATGDTAQAAELLRAHSWLKTASDEHGETPLHAAAASGQVKIAEMLIAHGASLNTRSTSGNSPLHRAARLGHAEVVKLLAKAGASVHALDSEGGTPLHDAADTGQVAAIEALLDAGAGLEAKDDSRTTPLHRATIREHPSAVAVLLARGANVNAVAETGDVALNWAVERANEDLVKLLLAKGASTSTTNRAGISALWIAAGRNAALVKLLLGPKAPLDLPSQGLTPLQHAAVKGKADIVEALLAAGADWRIRTAGGWTALDAAAMRHHRAVVETLLRQGARFGQDSVGTDGKGALHWLAAMGMTAEVKQLLAQGWLVDARAKDGWTPLHHACLGGHAEVVDALLAAKADAKLKDTAGVSVLNRAVRALRPEALEASLKASGLEPGRVFSFIRLDDPTLRLSEELPDNASYNNAIATAQPTPAEVAARAGIIRRLVAAGADAEGRDESGLTPLHQATFTAAPELLEALLTAKPPLNPRAALGFTPLHCAVSMGHLEAGRVLLASSADPNPSRGEPCEVPLRLAIRLGNRALVELLLQHKADPNFANSGGNTPLHLAVQLKRLDLVELLLQHKAEVKVRNKAGIAPLDVAAKEGDQAIAAILLANGAEADVRDGEGFTPLNTAAEHRQRDVAKLLLKQHVTVDTQSDSGDYPLGWAATHGDLELVAMLLDHGAGVGVRSRKSNLSALHFATFSGKLEVCRLLLAKGASLATLAEPFGTPLDYAAAGRKRLLTVHHQISSSLRREGKVIAPQPIGVEADYGKLVELFLRHDADANAWSSSRPDAESPLMTAVGWGHTEAVKLLLQHGAKVTLTNGLGGTALHGLGTGRASVEVAELLLKAGAAVNAKNSRGETPLLRVAMMARPGLLRVLLTHQSDVTVADGNGATPLHWAVRTNSVEAVRLLLAHGANANSRDKFGEHALFGAIWGNQPDIIRLVLEHGAEVNATNTVTQGTPLTTAAMVGNPDVVGMLLARGAKMEALHQGNATALALAANYHRAPVVDLLVAQGADKRFQADGWHLLMMALMDIPGAIQEKNLAANLGARAMMSLQPAFPGDQLATVRSLLKAGLDPNASSRDGNRNPLTLAAVYGLARVVEELLAAGANPLLEGKSGFTPFHEAIDRGQVAVLDLLLRHDRKILEHVNRPVPLSGRTPLHIAAMGFFANDRHFVAPDYGATVTWLVAHGAKTETMVDGMTPLVLSAKSGNVPALSALLAAGAEVNARSRSGETALHWAISKKNHAMVKELLAYKADPNLSDLFGISPLSAAQGNGSRRITALLREHGARP